MTDEKVIGNFNMNSNEKSNKDTTSLLPEGIIKWRHREMEKFENNQKVHTCKEHPNYKSL